MPFAQKGLKNNIPEERDSSNPGQASLAEGFPAATMVPINQGGVPPSGRDMNGILYLLAQHIQYLNAGGTYTFDGNFAAKNGGYPIGAILQAKNQGFPFWVNTVDGNATDPNNGGTGWKPLINLSSADNNQLVWKNDGLCLPLKFTSVEQGGGPNQSTNKINLGWDGKNLRLSVDYHEQGPLALLNAIFGGIKQIGYDKDGVYVTDANNTRIPVITGPLDINWWKKQIPLSKNPGLLSWNDDGLTVTTQAAPNLKTQYVSTSLGDNSRVTSTPEKPLKTLWEAVNRLGKQATGATIYLHVGETYYTTADGSSKARFNEWLHIEQRKIMILPYCLDRNDDPVLYDMLSVTEKDGVWPSYSQYGAVDMKRPVISCPVATNNQGSKVAASIFQESESSLIIAGCILEYTPDLNAWGDVTNWGDNTKPSLLLGMFAPAGTLQIQYCVFRNLRPGQSLFQNIHNGAANLLIDSKFLETNKIVMAAGEGGDPYNLKAYERSTVMQSGKDKDGKKIEYQIIESNAVTVLSQKSNWKNLNSYVLNTVDGRQVYLYDNLTTSLQIK